ncbi:MAG: hypothetical protein HUK14_06160 [Muribaculaceae bacterium]|nr:hypothetical protein [Muribaculaceae bacterium]
MSNQYNPIKAITQKELDAMLRNMASSDRPPIRNFRVQPKESGTAPEYLHGLTNNPLAVDFGVNLPESMRKKPMALTPEKCQEVFGMSQSVKMNFVPQMLNAVMLAQTTSLVNYCRDNRIGEIKKHTRVLRASVEEYDRRLEDAYGPMPFKAYTHYVERFRNECSTDIWMMQLHADELCRNQLPEVKHREIASRTLIILMLIAFVRNYDKEIDKLIASKIGSPVHQKPDACHEAIRAMCISIGEDLGFKILPDKTIGDWVRVLSNKASLLADTIIGEEGLS